MVTAAAEAANFPEVEILLQEYNKLFSLFANCHNAYSHSAPVSSSDNIYIASLGKLSYSITHASILLKGCHSCTSDLYAETSIHKFLKQYHSMFPESAITPKMHILQEHVIEWMKRWHVGLGLHGEQGAESVHNKFNQLQRQFACIRDPLNLLKLILKEHYVHVNSGT